MKKQLLCLSLAAMMSIGTVSVTAFADDAVVVADAVTKDTTPRTMFRLYNPNSGEHFYTASAEEKSKLLPLGWRDEGTGWIAPTKSATPVYRLYNPNEGDHHYTMSQLERDTCVKAGWNYEGIGWYSADSDMDRQKLYREFNPNERVGTHNYTTSIDEHNHLVSIGWRNEGTAWYGLTTIEPNQNAAVDENLTGTYNVRFNEQDITSGGDTEEPYVTIALDVYDIKHYAKAAVESLKAGYKVVIDGKKVEAKTVTKSTGNVKMVGTDGAEYEFVLSDDGTYRYVQSSDYTPSYKIGSMVAVVDNDHFVFNNMGTKTDLQGFYDYLREHEGQEFSEMQTQATFSKDGMTALELFYIP